MDKLGEGTFLQGYTVWFNIPFLQLLPGLFIHWIRWGKFSKSFEGSANDIPITQISRTVEIDMRDMLDEKIFHNLLLQRTTLCYKPNHLILYRYLYD